MSSEIIDNNNQAKCPMSLDEIDLFAPGAQKYWYDSYKILHNEAPVHRIPGEGTSPDTDGFIPVSYTHLTLPTKA